MARSDGTLGRKKSTKSMYDMQYICRGINRAREVTLLCNILHIIFRIQQVFRIQIRIL